MKNLKEQIEVMQQFLNGGEIEAINEHVDYWYDEKKPNWDWNLHDYRIKEKPKDKIVIEKWLYKSNKGYYKTCETDNIDKCLDNSYGFGVEKIKLLDTYEVEV